MTDGHPFRKLMQGQAEKLQALSRASYEESRVKYFLTTFGLPKYWEKKIRERSQAATGTWQMTFKALGDALSSFPWLLGADPLDDVKMHLDPFSMIPSLFKDFESSPLFKAFVSHLECTGPDAQGRGRGLVVRRKGVRSGMLIIDDTVPFPETLCGLTWKYRAKSGARVHVAAFATFLATLRDENIWRP